MPASAMCERLVEVVKLGEFVGLVDEQWLDLIDELQLSLYPYVAREGTRLFHGVPRSFRLDVVSSTVSSDGIVGLHYRRHRYTGGRLR